MPASPADSAGRSGVRSNCDVAARPLPFGDAYVDRSDGDAP